MRYSLPTIVLALISGIAVAGSLVDWQDYGKQIAPLDHSATHPCVVYDEEAFGEGVSDPSRAPYYKVYYNHAGTGTYLATSPDGVEFDEKRLVKPGANVPCVLYDSEGFGGGSPYRMWYAKKFLKEADHHVISSLEMSESEDGINWKQGKMLTDDKEYGLVGKSHPLFGAGTYGPLTVLYNAEAPDKLDDTNVMNNKFVMYYDLYCVFIGEDKSWNIREGVGLAYSTDGRHWKRYGDSMVLMLDPPQGTHIVDAAVVKRPDGYLMWYLGSVGTKGVRRIGAATSKNGMNWENTATSIDHMVVVDDYKGTYGLSVVYCPEKGLYEMWRGAKAKGEKERYCLMYSTLAAE